MPAIADGNLHVYMVSVGQGDTSVIVSPEGNVLVIDAMRPTKVLRLLRDLGCDDTIEHLVVTHPHGDHFGGCNRLAEDLTILEATVAPFWHESGMGPATYRGLMGRLEAQDTNVTFLSGYGRWYPDGAMAPAPPNQYPVIDPNKPFLELLGPTNGLVQMLEDADVFQTNHLSIMSRLSWGDFRMIIAGDAQMENWSFFDREGMLEEDCQVLRTAHHGSSNGTQWERIDRLSPRQVIVSSDPGANHELPDLGGAAIFAKFDSAGGEFACITGNTGTIHLQVTATGHRTLEMYGDPPAGNIDLQGGTSLTEATNPTDWRTLLNTRIATL